MGRPILELVLVKNIGITDLLSQDTSLDNLLGNTNSTGGTLSDSTSLTADTLNKLSNELSVTQYDSLV